MMDLIKELPPCPRTGRPDKRRCRCNDEGIVAVTRQFVSGPWAALFATLELCLLFGKFVWHRFVLTPSSRLTSIAFTAAYPLSLFVAAITFLACIPFCIVLSDFAIGPISSGV
jgi:hypothetical protein